MEAKKQEKEKVTVVKGHPNCKPDDCTECHNMMCPVHTGWEKEEYEEIEVEKSE